MSEENFDPIQSGAPEMDQETYEFIQELFQLARTGDTERLEKVFEMGFAAPNLRDGKGNSLLMLASYNRQYETTRLLLKHGGDPQLANDRGQIPLSGAAFNGDTEMARLLIEHGAEVNARDPDGKTSLMFAAMFNRTEIIDLLLTHGADFSLKTSDGKTALELARAMGAAAAAARLGQADG